ncbi:MAG: hypothetical protein WCI87_04740 [Euryarchaeota archaeon]
MVKLDHNVTYLDCYHSCRITHFAAGRSTFAMIRPQKEPTPGIEPG